MSDRVIYLDRFQLREGKFTTSRGTQRRWQNSWRRPSPGHSPSTTSWIGMGLGVRPIFVFSDAEAMDLRLDLASSRFQEGSELLSATEIELLGRPSDRAIELARSFNASLKPKLAGFSR